MLIALTYVSLWMILSASSWAGSPVHGGNDCVLGAVREKQWEAAVKLLRPLKLIRLILRTGN